MTFADFIIIGTLIIAVIIGVLYYLNRWASKKMVDQEEMIEKTKQTIPIYVIDKRKMKVAESSLPKSVLENMPRRYKFIKVYLVKAKVGPQILTMICDKKVFNALPIKKNVKAVVAGIYIMEMVGMKSSKEMKEMKQQKAAQNAEPKKPWYKFFSKG